MAGRYYVKIYAGGQNGSSVRTQSSIGQTDAGTWRPRGKDVTRKEVRTQSSIRQTNPCKRGTEAVRPGIDHIWPKLDRPELTKSGPNSIKFGLASTKHGPTSTKLIHNRPGVDQTWATRGGGRMVTLVRWLSNAACIMLCTVGRHRPSATTQPWCCCCSMLDVCSMLPL